jgi:hypothetical protein
LWVVVFGWRPGSESPDPGHPFVLELVGFVEAGSGGYFG